MSSGSSQREGAGSSSYDAASSAPEVEGTGPAEPGQSETGRAEDSAQDSKDKATGKSDGPQGGEEQPEDGKPAARTARRRGFARELLILAVVALALALVIRTFVIQPFFIPSGSMEDTLNIGDRVLINKIVYDFRGIHRGDVIVFDGRGSWDLNASSSSGNPVSSFFNDLGSMVGVNHDTSIYVKRVIGLPGDHVVCCDARGQITVNGVALSETSYLYPGDAPSNTRFSITVPAGRLWVMGDHRSVSYDSRGHVGNPGGGTIPESSVLGRAFVIIWPTSRWGILNIPATFEQPKLALAAAGQAMPLALGFAGAVPLTLLRRTARRRLVTRRSQRR
jgi:signal peptidase I